MIILDPPYISKELIEYIENSTTTILKNETAEKELRNSNINLVSEEEFINLANKNSRIYTASENSLDWIIQNIDDENLHNNIETMKNKSLFREKIQDMYPDFFYKEANLEELSEINPENLKYPFILKPKVGFFSIGVYTINNKEDWNKSINDIKEISIQWEKEYPKSVVNNEFILEEYIYGEEFAIDAYYDEFGNAVILNILKHDFSGINDVSDRLYYTGKTIIEKYLEEFTNWLNEVNKYLNIKNFPFHVEIRTNGKEIKPIEFNPMRFAGWCCADLSKFAFDFYSYDYYLQNKKPNWKEILKNRDNSFYTIVVMNKSEEIKNFKKFNYEKACTGLGEIVTIRTIDYNSNSIFGFLFTKIENNNSKVMNDILTRDFNNYLE